MAILEFVASIYFCIVKGREQSTFCISVIIWYIFHVSSFLSSLRAFLEYFLLFPVIVETARNSFVVLCI